MEIFGVGASELLFILIIAIIVLGPRDMQKAGRTIGRWLSTFVRSDSWRALQRASQEIKRIPTHLMREANLDADELRQMDQEIRRSIDPRRSFTGEPRRNATSKKAEPPADLNAGQPQDE
jgi:sec-independent protein translocase protein TatB